MAEETANPDVLEALKGLPACLRCRLSHRRCDTSLPRCRNCAKSGVDDCIFYDHVLQQNFPRIYLKSLASKVETLRQRQNLLRERLENEGSVAEPQGSPPSTRSPGLVSVPLQAYVGPSACVPTEISSSSVERLAEMASPLVPALILIDEAASNLEVNREMHHFLLDIFFTHLHSVLPVVDKLSDFAWEGLDHDKHSSALNQFRRQMMYAISCHCVPVHANKFAVLSKACLRRAQRHLAEATFSISIETLRNIILISLLGLFEPAAINFGQALSLAGRLCLDLNILNIEHRRFRYLYLTVLCMERQVSLSLDRPSFLPAPDRPGESAGKEPVEILSSLMTLRTACTGNNEDEATAALLRSNLDEVSLQIQQLPRPNAYLVASLRQVEFLMDPSSLSRASSFLSALANPSCFHTFMTPWWIFRAGCTIPRDSRDRDGTDHILCLRLLEIDAGRWPTCRLLAGILIDRGEADSK